MEDADTSTWPEKCVNLYLTNYLAGKENTKAVGQLNSEEFIIRVENSSKDLETGTCKIKLPNDLNLSQTAKLPTILKICVSARLFLTFNINYRVKSVLIRSFSGPYFPAFFSVSLRI